MTDKDLAKNEATEIEIKKQLDEFIKFVNHDPPKDRVLNHPLAAGVKYMPIGDIETMLTKVFKLWDVEILREGQLLNSVYVTVRLNYFHPIIGEWRHQDGIGAVAIQTDKDKDASELKYIKSNAIMLALPAAKSFAIKDAAEHIGKVFGRDINRKDVMLFTVPESHDSLAPNNQLILVNQIKQLQMVAEEYSGLGVEGAKEWFYELTGLQYSQVKKFEFDYVLQKLSDERLV